MIDCSEGGGRNRINGILNAVEGLDDLVEKGCHVHITKRRHSLVQLALEVKLLADIERIGKVDVVEDGVGDSDYMLSYQWLETTRRCREDVRNLQKEKKIRFADILSNLIKGVAL